MGRFGIYLVPSVIDFAVNLRIDGSATTEMLRDRETNCREKVCGEAQRGGVGAAQHADPCGQAPSPATDQSPHPVEGGLFGRRRRMERQPDRNSPRYQRRHGRADPPATGGRRLRGRAGPQAFPSLGQNAHFRRSRGGGVVAWIEGGSQKPPTPSAFIRGGRSPGVPTPASGSGHERRRRPRSSDADPCASEARHR
jgi:hypothetical protein